MLNYNLNLLKDNDKMLYPFANPYEKNQEDSLIIVEGDGVFVKDINGNKYIEGIAGLWSTSLGFGQSKLIKAASEQMLKLSAYHTGNSKTNIPALELAERLLNIAPKKYSKVFFCSSGSEANDTQIKLLWYFNNALGRSNKKKVITRKSAYHGSTIISGGLSGMPNVYSGFDRSNLFISTESPDYLKNMINDETELQFIDRIVCQLENLLLKEDPETVAAFIAEPVMAAGGIIIPHKDYFSKIEKVLKKYDIRMIDDEVICGFGRTGAMWGADTYNMNPHSISLAKALTSGYLPMGAVLIDEEMYEVILHQSKKSPFYHGFTYSGNPVTSAVALATLDLMEELNIVTHVKNIEHKFKNYINNLEKYQIVKTTRAEGLLGAIDFSDFNGKQDEKLGKAFVKIALKNGVILRNLGHTIAFCPPLIISESELDIMFNSVSASIEELEERLGSEKL